jgi:hypothetical protein
MGLIVAPDKVQKQSPFSYLGLLRDGLSVPQKTEISKDNLKTLNDFQKLLGDRNWLHPALKLTTCEHLLSLKVYRETLNHHLLDISHQKVVWPWLRLNKLFTTLREFVLIILNQYNLSFCLLQVYPQEFFGSLREC